MNNEEIVLDVKALQNVFGGNTIPSGSTTLFLSESGEGKTSVLIHIAKLVMSQNKKVLFLSSENTIHYLFNRVLYEESDSKTLICGNMSLFSAFEFHGISDLKDVLELVKERHFDLILIDDVSFLRPSEIGMDAKDGKFLKDYAKILGSAIVCSMKAARSSEGSFIEARHFQWNNWFDYMASFKRVFETETPLIQITSKREGYSPQQVTCAIDYRNNRLPDI